MVNFIQNHDQVANSARGLRVTSWPRRAFKSDNGFDPFGSWHTDAASGPGFGASTQFLFFADHHKELGRQVRRGPIDFLTQWKGLNLPEMKACFADPALARHLRTIEIGPLRSG